MKETTKPRKLTRKQQAFVTTLLSNPKISATQAVKQVYNVNSDNTARSIASENLTKPNIVSMLQNHSELVESVLVTDVIQYKDSDKLSERQLANDTSRWIHDKIHGKSKQVTEVTSTGVTLTIDLSSSLTDTPTDEK